MTDPKNPKERLKKLYALAMRGVGGEKQTAQAILEKLLKKYAVSLDDLDEDIVSEYQLEYHGEDQERLLKQTVYKVTDNENAFYSLYWTRGEECQTILGVQCTAAQKLEIEFLFDFYTRVWEKEREALFHAFVQKHKIFGKLKNREEGMVLSDEELEKMCALMRGLSNETPLLQIEEETPLP